MSLKQQVLLLIHTVSPMVDIKYLLIEKSKIPECPNIGTLVLVPLTICRLTPSQKSYIVYIALTKRLEMNSNFIIGIVIVF